jgi:hypothetical protein
MWQRLLCGVVLALVCAIPGAPQDALVVPLSNEETAHARELYQRMVAAQEAFIKYKDEIRLKYGPKLGSEVPESRRVRVNIKGPGGVPALSDFTMPLDWFEGIEFTTDFRFAVPKRNKK